MYQQSYHAVLPSSTVSLLQGKLWAATDMSVGLNMYSWGPEAAWPYISGAARCEGLCLKSFSPKCICGRSIFFFFWGRGGGGGGFIFFFSSICVGLGQRR